jgi:GTP cyclohydrolase FolE2
MGFAEAWHHAVATPDDGTTRLKRVVETDSERLARQIKRRTEEAAVLARLVARPKAVEDAVAPILARFLPGGRSENALEAFAQAFETARESALSLL